MTVLRKVWFNKTAIIWQLAFTAIIYLTVFLIAKKYFTLTEAMITLFMSYLCGFGAYVLLSLRSSE